MFHIAAQLGDRFGIICYHESVIPRQITQTRMYGMENWIAGRRASGFKLKDIGANKDEMKKNFIAAGRSLIERGRRRRHHRARHHPMPGAHEAGRADQGPGACRWSKGIGAPIRMAAMLAGLGLKHSRKRWPKSNARPKL